MSINDKSNGKRIVQVAIDTPINRQFDYFWNVSELGVEPRRGQLIAVPFGKKEIAGVVINEIEHSSYEISKLKDCLLYTSDAADE